MEDSHIPKRLSEILPNMKMDKFYIGKSSVTPLDSPQRWQAHKHTYDIMIVLYASSNQTEILNLEERLIKAFANDPHCDNKLPYHPGRPGSACKYALYVCIRYRQTSVCFDYFIDLATRSQSSKPCDSPKRQKAINVLVDTIDRILQQHHGGKMQIRLTYDSSKLVDQFREENFLYILTMVTEWAIPNGLHGPTHLIEYAASLERALNYHYQYNEQNDDILYTPISGVETPTDGVFEAFLYLQIV